MENKNILSRRILFSFLSILFSLSVLFPLHLLADTTYSSGAVSEQKSSDSLFKVTGYLSGRYVYRSAYTSDNQWRDQDIFGELRLDVVMPKENRYEFHFFGTARDDFSDNRNQTTFDPFKDIGDTYQSSYHGYLYEAHFDINNPFRYFTQIRMGRQAGTRDEQVFFDGIAADIRAASSLNLTLYGGAAVHLYEVNNHWGDDTLAGAGLDYAPGSSTRVSLDYLSVKDEQTSPTTPATTDFQDQMISLKIWQSFASFMKASAKYRYLNGEPRDLSVRAVSAFPEADIEMNVNYFRQFRTQNELSNELSLFFAVMGTSSPYQSIDVKLRKLFGAHYALDVGYFKRSLLEENQESAFDRDFSRTFLLFEIIDLPKDGLSFTLTGERWETNGREYSSAGFDVGYAFKNKKSASINVGTYYSLYKYDYYIEEGLRQNVRTYYLSGRYPLGRGFSINGSYEYESSIENYQTLKLGMRYDF
ncbi:MAG TPA: hypothetical protein VLG72_09330 [Nitrospirota bacterium]|nr:hypothetical protein [Nitrospirota bacterium]